ncbi:hypothetical protein GUITHDRAFT_145247 [Guillardia theta CCMP2712]|uniref:Uncharacterized protein n=1 Tax=Guillardia theta (strain CCMP2712) TaxID=905079 RepID=L1ILZ3_GUITC|nr:hypothetical protein GUITHDRAFT_145247 [Guillardia theta CCMP2712]EKX37147.1 hypothetical protein GUITHDRAFT_145247 [Guillardia theta CCMP2712]|eukprot:XP_005824127.1 hypothetical protein GUITHDRAFT_145247 [Guillardia theta CCMP2712]
MAPLHDSPVPVLPPLPTPLSVFDLYFGSRSLASCPPSDPSCLFLDWSTVGLDQESSGGRASDEEDEVTQQESDTEDMDGDCRHECRAIWVAAYGKHGHDRDQQETAMIKQMQRSKACLGRQ